MGAHAGVGGLGVARQNGGGDLAVLADGGFEHIGSEDVADLRHDQWQAQAKHNVPQLPVAAQLNDRRMEKGVFGQIATRLARPLIEDRLDRSGKFRALLIVGGLRRESGGERLEFGADREQFAYFPSR
jgi:hypothetical protein